MTLFFDANFDATQPIVLSHRGFIITHLLLPIVFLAPTFAVFHWGDADIWLGAHFYDGLNHQWPYKDFWLTQSVFHQGGRILFFTIAAGMLLLLLASFKNNWPLKNYRRHLSYLFVASITSPIICIIAKSKAAIFCPWDLELFGGLKPHIHLLESLEPLMKGGHCFPAAHASSGYAFVSLYFFLLTVKPEYKFYGLNFGLGLGGIYGVTQQLRGAHFLSHDLCAVATCWYSSLFLFWLFFRKQLVWK